MRDDPRKRSRLEELQEAIRWLLRRKEKPPEGDPYAYVGAPLRRGPAGRGGAAAAEIENYDYRSYPPRS